MYYGNLGTLLSETRESKKLSLEEVSRECNVSKTYLQFIEHGLLYQLPSYTHARSFVRKYAEFLNFNYKKDIEYLFDSECVRDVFDSKNIDNSPVAQTDITPNMPNQMETSKKEKHGGAKHGGAKHGGAKYGGFFSPQNKNPQNTTTPQEESLSDPSNNNENVLSYINFKDMPDITYDHAPRSHKNSLLLYIVISGVAVLTIIVAALAFWNKKTSNIDPIFIDTRAVAVDTTDSDANDFSQIRIDAPIPYSYLSASSLGIAPTLNTYYISLISGELANDSTSQFRSLPLDSTETPPNVTYADATPSIIPVSENNTAYIKFTGESWVQVESDTGDSFELIGENGNSIPFVFKSSFTLTLGNIGGAYIEYNNNRITTMGDEGQILRNKVFTLDPKTQTFAITNKPRGRTQNNNAGN